MLGDQGEASSCHLVEDFVDQDTPWRQYPLVCRHGCEEISKKQGAQTQGHKNKPQAELGYHCEGQHFPSNLAWRVLVRRLNRG